jgi:tetratricopeptide (TPR) repeat protein
MFLKKIATFAFLFCLIVHFSVWSQSKASRKAYTKAIASLNKGQTEKGFTYLNQAIRLDSSYKEAWYARAYYAFDQDKYQEALRDFNHLIQLYPQDTTFYRYRALTHLYLQNFEAAEKDLQKAISIDKNNEATYSDLGYVYYQWGKSEQAQAQFDKSLQIKPNRTAWYYKALASYESGKKDLAVQQLDKSLALDAKYPNGLRLKARMLADVKKYAEAGKVYEQLLNDGTIAEPADFRDWGLLYYRQKKYTDAFTYFTMPEKHDDALLYYYTGLTQYRLKKYPEALQSLDKALALSDPAEEENAPVFYDRSIVRFQSGDGKGAVADFFKAIYLMPELTKRQSVTGDTLDLLGSAPVLLKNLYSKKQLDSIQIAGYRDRAVILLEEEGQEKVVLSTINQAIALDSTQSGSYFIRGRMHYLTGEYAQALKDFNKAFRYSKEQTDDAYHYYLRGLAYFEMELYDEAYDDLTRAITLEDKEPAYLYDRAYLLAAIGDFNEAIKDITKAISLSEDDEQLLLARAGFYNESGQYDPAVGDCNTLLTKDNSNAFVYFIRGYAFMGLNKNKEAIADFSKALQIDPELEEARVALDELVQK